MIIDANKGSFSCYYNYDDDDNDDDDDDDFDKG